MYITIVDTKGKFRLFTGFLNISNNNKINEYGIVFNFTLDSSPVNFYIALDNFRLIKGRRRYCGPNGSWSAEFCNSQLGFKWTSSKCFKLINTMTIMPNYFQMLLFICYFFELKCFIRVKISSPIMYY